MAQRICLFCERAVSLTDEHILPSWLLEYLNIKDEQISPTHMDAAGKVVSTRRHILDNLVHGKICSDCNSGWMSRLENQAKPLLISLMEGQRGVAELTKEERFVIARWICKTAGVLNSASNFRVNVPQEHFTHLYKLVDSLPPFVTAFAQQHHGQSKFYWIQRTFEMFTEQKIELDSSEAQRLVNRSYKITLQLKKLLLIVAYWPWPDWLFLMWRGIHVPLWPIRGPVTWYGESPIGKDFPWYDSLEAVAAFHVTLRVIHPTSPMMA